jgi:hypothetical protein
MPGQSNPHIDANLATWKEFVQKHSDGEWHECPAELPKPSPLYHLRKGDTVSVIEKGEQGAGLAAIREGRVVRDYSSQGVVEVQTVLGKTYRFNGDGSISGHRCAQVIAPALGRES